MKKKNYTIFLLHRHFFDFKWYLPIILFLKKKFEVTLVFKYFPPNSIACLIPEDINFIFIKDTKIKKIIKKFFKLDLNFRRINSLIINSENLAIPYVRNAKKLDVLRKHILNQCKLKKKKIIFFPPISSDILFELPLELKQEKIIVITESQKKYLLEKKFEKVISTGAVDFDKKNIFYQNRIYSIKYNFKFKKKSILFILKNQNSNIFKYVDFEKMLSSAFNNLNSIDKFVYLKPHPQQDLKMLNEIIKKSRLKNYQIIQLPIQYIASKVEYVISLFSGGILESLAVGSPPFLFWPADKFLKKGKKIKANKSFYRVMGKTFLEAKLYKKYTINIRDKFVFNKNKKKTILLLRKFRDSYIKEIEYKHFYI